MIYANSYFRYVPRSFSLDLPVPGTVPGYPIMIRAPVAYTHPTDDPVKNTPSPYGGLIIYHMVFSVFPREPVNPRTTTPFSITKVLYFCIRLGSVDMGVRSGKLDPDIR